ncbi:MAG: DUF58 domain-containing protein [Lentisphaeria bacterium]|nr:DUF58 domain-containing protein [Lentisphaeria bacterium]
MGIPRPHDHLDESQFFIAVRRLADNLTYGTDVSPFLGAGVDYAQSRLYQDGDPVKSMDWRVTARTGRYHVKEYEAPKQMPIYMVMDTSASMCVSSIPMSKYAWAVQIAAGLALVALRRMSPVGLMGCGERELHVRPTLSKHVVMRWTHQLRHYDLTEATSLSATLRTLPVVLRERSLVMVLSDMHDQDSVGAIRRLAQEHDCIALMFQDPAERGRIGGGVFRAREAESGHRFTAHGRRRWLAADPYTKDLVRAGVDCLTLRTDQPFLGRLRNFLKHRDVLGRCRL